jgi:polyisoprenoid-binding protein YceI
MKHRVPSLAALLVMATSPVFAQHQTLTINPDSSEVKMTLKTNHDIVNGTFHIQSATIDFDRKDSHLGGTVVVAAGSGKTGNDSRDKKMDKDILNVQQYTTVTFAPKGYSGTIAPNGDSTIQVEGMFTLLGTPHDVTIPMQIHLDGANCTVKAHLVVPYVQWGLKDPSFMVWKAEKQVDVDLNLVGRIL